MTAEPWTTARENAEVLLWQGRVRVVVAIIAGIAGLVLQQARVLPGHSSLLSAVIAGYVATIGLLTFATRRMGGAGNLLVAATVLSDLESKVLSLYLDGHSYTHIGELLGCDGKTVDNALQRVKRKVGAHLNSRAVML